MTCWFWQQVGGTLVEALHLSAKALSTGKKQLTNDLMAAQTIRQSVDPAYGSDEHGLIRQRERCGLRQLTIQSARLTKSAHVCFE